MAGRQGGASTAKAQWDLPNWTRTKSVRHLLYGWLSLVSVTYWNTTGRWFQCGNIISLWFQKGFVGWRLLNQTPALCWWSWNKHASNSLQYLIVFGLLRRVLQPFPITAEVISTFRLFQSPPAIQMKPMQRIWKPWSTKQLVMFGSRLVLVFSEAVLEQIELVDLQSQRICVQL